MPLKSVMLLTNTNLHQKTHFYITETFNLTMWHISYHTYHLSYHKNIQLGNVTYLISYINLISNYCCFNVDISHNIRYYIKLIYFRNCHFNVVSAIMQMFNLPLLNADIEGERDPSWPEVVCLKLQNHLPLTTSRILDHDETVVPVTHQ